MRWKFSIPIMLVVTVLFGTLIFMGTIIERTIEVTGTSILKARVDVGDVDVSYFPFSVSIYNLEVTNPDKPMYNMLDISRLTGGIRFFGLLEKKVLIDELAIKDISIDTKRRYSGAIPVKEKGSKKKKKQSKVLKKVSESKLAQSSKSKVKEKTDALKNQFQLPDMSESIELESTKKAEELQSTLSTVSTKWKTRMKDNPIQSELASISSEWASFQALGKAEKNDLVKIQKQLKALQSIQKKGKALNTKVKAEKSALDTDFNTVSLQTKEIQRAGDRDYKRAASKLKVDDIDFKSVTDMYLSGMIKERLTPIFDIVNKVRRYSYIMKGKKVDKPKGIRHPGLTIPFPIKNDTPKFWIKSIIISGKGKGGESLSGDIQNITSDQSVVGMPMTGQLVGVDFLGKGHRFSSSFVQKLVENEDPLLTVTTQFTGFKLSQTPIIEQNKKSLILKSGDLIVSVNADLQGDRINAEGLILGDNLKFSSKGVSASEFSLEAILFSSIKRMDTFKVTADVDGTLDDWNLSLGSKLDRLDVTGAANQKLAQKRRQLKAKLQGIVSKNVSTARSSIDKEKAVFNSQVTQYKRQATQLENQVNNRIKEETDKLNAIKKEAEDKVKKEVAAREAALKKEADAKKAKLKKEAEEKAKKEASKMIKGLGF